MNRNRWIAGFLLSFLFAVFFAVNQQAVSQDISGEELWAKAKTTWDNDITSYECKLFSYTYRTDTYIKNFPDNCEPGDKEDWDYRVFGIKFKKPDKILFTYDQSLNEDTENGTMIDKAVAYMLQYAHGTTFNYGHRDKDTVYIVFPYLTNSQFKKLPIPLVWKGAMKLLMIASRKEVYHQTLDELRDLRGNELVDLSIGNTMKRFDHYFKDGEVTVSMAPLYTKKDFDLNEKTNRLSFKSGVSQTGNIYKLTMVPKDLASNKGITKVETFIDPATNMFNGMIEYEETGIVTVMFFSDLKLNTNPPDQEWEDFFKNRTLSDKK
ncbi:MAG TPA: hypothetical protein PLN69_07250 [bacterium]|nr:hypothetical protein [bacterium]